MKTYVCVWIFCTCIAEAIFTSTSNNVENGYINLKRGEMYIYEWECLYT